MIRIRVWLLRAVDFGAGANWTASVPCCRTSPSPTANQSEWAARSHEGSRLRRAWRERAFEHIGDQYRLRPEFRRNVEFLRQDIRTALPETTFHLVLCRNLVFTYFDAAVQRQTLQRIRARIVPGGALVIGKGESLPCPEHRLTPWSATLGVYCAASSGTQAESKRSTWV